ncbi:5-formyltetrahydrofolate cyclo-ligase [Poseidonocella pacifica]|uniref:5-formyltetrahydrofolate cyclo-ligase n=1 Tax=Poseidonocella pacifica TaxID=871651 RepID=A0A1I0WBZ1_9RHOB|nr:5-formyltetrahydrofolate cyclo-ligase [Poseidonocella pacifica]SFA85426.1 5-formyltetrahydrofolate cyclo-ligase [Poseidonocella pacifica]
MDTLNARKAAARKAAFAARAEAHAKGDGDAAALLDDVLRAYRGKPLSGFLPIRTEIDPRPAMKKAAEWGPVGVPVIRAKGEPLEFAVWEPESPLVEGTFGTLVPQEERLLVPEVLVVPLLAFNRAGGRLGYGGGFYDRTLERLRANGPVVAIGFAYAAQEVADVPLEPTDQPLDLIVTEREVIGQPGL